MLKILVITLFSGERDFIFRFILINILILWVLKILKTKQLIILVPLLFLLIPLSSMFKYYFLRGSVNTLNTNVFHSLFSGEFESASRNLQILINCFDQTNGIKGFSQIILDLVSVFDSSINSTSTWFNSMFYSGSQTQYGFSLVGEGYLIGGYFGVVFLFMLIGVIIKIFYVFSNRNLYLLAAYLYFITITIYSIRGDFGIILSGIAKQICLVLSIVYLCQKISFLKSD
ncbi:MAG: O-antigen polymerase [Holdemania massiliensis]